MTSATGHRRRGARSDSLAVVLVADRPLDKVAQGRLSSIDQRITVREEQVIEVAR